MTKRKNKISNVVRAGAFDKFDKKALKKDQFYITIRATRKKQELNLQL